MQYEARTPRDPDDVLIGWVDLFIDGRRVGGCHENAVVSVLAHSVASDFLHFQEIYERLKAGDERIVIADRKAYSIGSAEDYPRGFGGQGWRIGFYDGRVALTNSLWSLGDVPDSWRHWLPDNARLTTR